MGVTVASQLKTIFCVGEYCQGDADSLVESLGNCNANLIKAVKAVMLLGEVKKYF